MTKIKALVVAICGHSLMKHRIPACMASKCSQTSIDGLATHIAELCVSHLRPNDPLTPHCLLINHERPHEEGLLSNSSMWERVISAHAHCHAPET